MILRMLPALLSFLLFGSCVFLFFNWLINGPEKNEMKRRIEELESRMDIIEKQSMNKNNLEG